ncbi:uncharacterized protein LOC116290647 [Actinia tenebrosa]|uniref:Uncharacterized protein LOC116290647 n=1 Tax=Actinia tenebrosa TaxID=6105 RepID=A0A6P8HD56_ACTTE|nr:uncharacterized protein LOC116290647 [Actinia tenebrosa]
MTTTSFAWLSFPFLLLLLHSVYSEKLQFLKVPKSREFLPVGANLTIDCTTNGTAQTAVYYRRKLKTVRWKKIEAIPGKVIHEGSVYTLLTLTRKNAGQYQCRAWKTTNSTEVRWPDNVGMVIIRGGRNKGKPVNKKPGQKKGKNKKPDQKKNNRKRPGQKRPGSKKPGGKRPGKKGPGLKKRGPQLKAMNNSLTVIEGSLAVLRCTARVPAGGGQPIISWYRSSKLIGCSDKKNSKCSSVKPYLINYNIGSGKRKRSTSYLKIKKTKRARDKGIYVCTARNKHGTSRVTIRLTIKKRRSS